MPSITVLMAVFNGMPYLPEAVESVFNQSIDDWRLLIVNDGSTDATADYLNGLAGDRVQVIHQQNQGLAASLNNGLAACDTEFVARLDSDDICYPRRLEKQLNFMRSHPELGMLGTQIERLGQLNSGFPSRLPCRHDAIVNALLKAEHAMVHPTIMCRTEIMNQVGGYWDLPIAQDWDLYLKISEQARVANLNECLLKYRIHTGSLNGQRLAGIRRNQRFAAERARRRQASLPTIEYEEFVSQESNRNWSWRTRERVNVFAMRQYRLALADILGGHEWRGYLRLGFAASSAPVLTSKRILRLIRHRISGSRPSSLSRAKIKPGAQGGGI